VQLVMGITQPRATCRACLDAGRRPVGTSSFVKAAGMLAVVLGLLCALLVFLAEF
jgi:hypothetical protein